MLVDQLQKKRWQNDCVSYRHVGVHDIAKKLNIRRQTTLNH